MKIPSDKTIAEAYAKAKGYELIIRNDPSMAILGLDEWNIALEFKETKSEIVEDELTTTFVVAYSDSYGTLYKCLIDEILKVEGMKSIEELVVWLNLVNNEMLT